MLGDWLMLIASFGIFGQFAWVEDRVTLSKSNEVPGNFHTM